MFTFVVIRDIAECVCYNSLCVSVAVVPAVEASLEFDDEDEEDEDEEDEDDTQDDNDHSVPENDTNNDVEMQSNSHECPDGDDEDNDSHRDEEDEDEDVMGVLVDEILGRTSFTHTHFPSRRLLAASTARRSNNRLSADSNAERESMRWRVSGHAFGTRGTYIGRLRHM